MGRGRTVLLALWVAANVAVLGFLVADPQMTRYMEGCSAAGMWVDWFGEGDGLRTLCGVETSSLVDREDVLTGALAGNGIVAAAWLLARPRRRPAVGASISS